MSRSAQVAKNSLWLIVQPIILNLLSLFAIPYIARVLGQVDYGRFTLGFSIVAMFMPLANMGLRAVTIRHVAKDRERSREYAGRMLGARGALAMATVLVIAVAANVLHYDAVTMLVVYLASITVLSEAIAGTLQDVFQAFEKMHYVAYSRFIGGFVLTVLSVVVLFVGWGLVGLTLSYVLGAMLTMAVSWFYANKIIGRPKLAIDWGFLRSGLATGAPFFYPTLVMVLCSKLGVSLLPLFGGMAAVGAYGVASTLIDRLGVIPDGICTAIYPTLTILHRDSRGEAEQLFRKYFEYMVLIGMPIAVGTTVIAKPIVLLLFGSQYLAAIPVLRVLSWSLFLFFLTSLQGWTLGAIHQEKKGALVGFITGPLGALFNLALIPHFHELGIAYASLCSTLVQMVLLQYFIRTRFVRQTVTWHRLVRLVGANALMGLLVYWVRELNIAIPLAVGVVSYPLLCLGTGVVGVRELRQLWNLVLRRGVANAPAPEVSG